MLSSRSALFSRALLRSCRRATSTTTSEVTASDPPAAPNPLEVADFFGVHQLFTVSDLFHSRVHLGHTATNIDPRMRDFVFGSRFGTAVIDLDQTSVMLRQALNFLAHLASRGGIVLFVARQPHLVHMVEAAAQDCGEYAHCRPWDSAIFTDSTKKFEGDIRLPDALVFLHTKEGTKYDDHMGIEDAAKMGIPTVAIVDTDCNPNIISYPVPGNDDTPQAVQLYLDLFGKAIKLGKEHRKKSNEK